MVFERSKGSIDREEEAKTWVQVDVEVLESFTNHYKIKDNSQRAYVIVPKRHSEDRPDDGFYVAEWLATNEGWI